MKIFLIIFFAVLLKCNFLLADEFSWNKIVTSKDGSDDYYLDSKSNRTIGNYNYQWILNNKIKDYNKVKSDITYTTIDCKRHKMQIILISDFSEHFGKGTITNHTLIPDDQLEWITAKPKTVMSFLIENSCNNVVSSISSDEDNGDLDEKKSKKSKKSKKKKSKYKEF